MTLEKTTEIYNSEPRTFEEYFLKYLVVNGMFSAQAEAVMATVKEDEATGSMAERWGDSFEGYPDTLIAVLKIGIRRVALEYIDKHCPSAWFRDVFVD